MQDEIIKMLAYEGRVSVICISSTKLVEEARKTHDLSPLSTAAFGRTLTMAAIMGNEMKSENDKLTVQIKGNGPIGAMLVTSNNKSVLKGYVTNPHVDLPLNEFDKLDVGGAVGTEGYINVIKDIGLKEPYIGVAPLTSGEIADDFANYFVNSEQRKAAVALGVLVNKDGVKQAGGYLIQAMPDATIDDITKLEKAIFEAGAISRMLDENMTLLEIAKKITADKNVKILERGITPIYKCDCSKEHLKETLKSIGKNEIQDIIQKEGKAEIVCHFCNKKYEFSKEELEELIKE